MISEYTIRVRLPNGTVNSVRIQAVSPGIALEQARAQFGSGSTCSIIESRYL